MLECGEIKWSNKSKIANPKHRHIYGQKTVQPSAQNSAVPADVSRPDKQTTRRVAAPLMPTTSGYTTSVPTASRTRVNSISIHKQLVFP